VNEAQSPSGQPTDPLMRAVAQYWEEIIQAADEEQRERLHAIVAGTIDPDPVETQVALDDELLDLLPPDHPVIRIMSTRTLYSTATADATDSPLADDLTWLRAQVFPSNPDDPERARPDEQADAASAVGARGAPKAPPTLDEFDRQVEARLLSLPSLTENEVRRNNVDPDDDGLIRLPAPNRAVRLPAFQFNPEGRPWPVLREVNRRLNAAADPWGVACWWVDPHQWLAASPATLLGEGRDDQLRWAAASIGQE